MVRFTKYLEVIEEENLVQNAEIVGKYLLEKLIELGNEFPNKIRNIRGRGLMCAIDFNSPQERDIFKNKCYDNGIVILGCGEQTIRFRPALNLTKEEVDEGLEIMKKVLMKM